MRPAYVLEGSPRHGLLLNLTYAPVILALPLVISFKEQMGGTPSPADAPFAIAFAGFGGYFLLLAARCAGKRRLEIDDQGIRLFVRSRLSWALAWPQVVEIGTRGSNFRYPFAGFYVRGETQTRRVQDTTEISPWIELRPAFREVVSNLEGRQVIMNDRLGWAQGTWNRFLKPGGVGEADLAAVEGRWVPRSNRLTGAFWVFSFFGSLCIELIVAPILLLNPSPLRSSIALFAPFFGGFGMICLAVGVADLMTTPTAVRVQADGLEMRFRGGRGKRVPWSGIAYCSMGRIPGEMGVGFRGSFRGWSGRFPPALAQAARRRWREANPAA